MSSQSLRGCTPSLKTLSQVSQVSQTGVEGVTAMTGADTYYKRY